MSEEKTYPECEKIAAVQDKSNVLGEFLDFLDSKGIELAKYGGLGGEELYPIYPGKEQLLADFFGIDLVKVEQERRAILADLQKKK